jgi:butyrate response factor 1
MVSESSSPVNSCKTGQAGKNQKLKYKKNALDFVDNQLESQKDPKYKTELCTTFSDTGFCAYGNKCRFAHGKNDLIDKFMSHPKYRKSDCLTFHTTGFCTYGTRCHFKHNYQYLKLAELNRSYFQWLLSFQQEEDFLKTKGSKRLKCFSQFHDLRSKSHKFYHPLGKYPNYTEIQAISKMENLSLLSTKLNSTNNSNNLSPIHKMQYINQNQRIQFFPYPNFYLNKNSFK